MRFIQRYLIAILAIVFVGSVFVFADKTNTSKDFEKNKKISFLDEQVPLHVVDVQERLDRELLVNTYWHSNTYLLMKRSAKYFPIIEPILKQNGIPDDFKYLAVIESGLTDAVSPAGARGFWQIMPKTAEELGLEISKTVDERYHLEKATHAACKYLLKSKEELGSWVLAAASYNVGLHSIKKRMKSQGVDSYYDVYLPEETARYVFRMIAVKEIMENPLKYDLGLTKEEYYEFVPTVQIGVDTTITDLAVFAKSMGVNYKALKIHNPWLRDEMLENKTNTKYKIAIPQKGYK